ncbi:MAG: hypothetical protein IKJ16_06045 [Agathobacter sp.]|nr:hypothetical protein [Agathobacter sp.]
MNLKNITKFIFAFAIMILLLSGSSSEAYAQTKTYTMEDLEGYYKTQGRTAVVDGTLMLDFSASGIEFTADCEGDVYVEMNVERASTAPTSGLYFTVVIDGKMQAEDLRIAEDNNADNWTSNSTGYPFHINKRGKMEFKIAEGLEKGKHTFGIYRQTEPVEGKFGLTAIKLDGEFLDPPAEKDLYFEFIGDSILAGYGNLSTGGTHASLYQDATRGWAYLVSQRMNADWSLVAHSGITATNGIGWNGKNSVSMQKMYPLQRYHFDKKTPYGFEREPDVIFVCLGTNDIWTYQTSDPSNTTDVIVEGIKEMANLVREKNPNAKIVWLYNMMTYNANMLIDTAIKEIGGEEKGFYTLMLPTNLEGGGGHPNLATQTVYADTICEYLDSTLLVDVDNGDDAGSINWVYPVLAAVGILVVIIVVVVVVLRKKKSTSEE